MEIRVQPLDKMIRWTNWAFARLFRVNNDFEEGGIDCWVTLVINYDDDDWKQKQVHFQLRMDGLLRLELTMSLFLNRAEMKLFANAII